MDVRTLLLARTLTVVLDGDRVAAAATRPTRDSDLDRFEDELAQRGFVLALDLATTMRRLPSGAIAELRAWIVETLDAHVVRAADRFAQPPAPASWADRQTPLAGRRLHAWIAERPRGDVQPCPWCAKDRELRSIAPCGHVVCATCWASGTYVGCPICHRRVSQIAVPAASGGFAERVRLPNGGKLRLLFLGFDVTSIARDRLAGLCSGAAPLSPDERAELEDLIDAVGPRAVAWLPRRFARPETMAIAIARLWLVAPDRVAIAKATAAHLRDATDVLRVAVLMMGGTPALVLPMRLASIARGLRRAVLDALERLPADEVIEHVMREPGLWKRAGERLHPFEIASAASVADSPSISPATPASASVADSPPTSAAQIVLARPTVALAFAVVRGTRLGETPFGAAVRAHASTVAAVRVADDGTLALATWAAPVEDGLRRGDPLTAIARLAQRPAQLLARVDHVLRVVAARAPATLPEVMLAIRSAIRRGPPGALLALLAHVRPRRDEVSRDIVAALRAELLARAEKLRTFPRAVLDRAIGPAAWELVAIHAVARANTIYVRIPGDASLPADIAIPRTPTPPQIGRTPTPQSTRAPTDPAIAIARAPTRKPRAQSEPGLAADGSGFATFRRRDGEPPASRLARVLAGDADDGRVQRISTADAPTWFAVASLADLTAPASSCGYVSDPTETTPFERASLAQLADELARP